MADVDHFCIHVGIWCIPIPAPKCQCQLYYYFCHFVINVLPLPMHLFCSQYICFCNALLCSQNICASVTEGLWGLSSISLLSIFHFHFPPLFFFGQNTKEGGRKKNEGDWNNLLLPHSKVRFLYPFLGAIFILCPLVTSFEGSFCIPFFW